MDKEKEKKASGPKGGARYPKDNLEKCVQYSKKLVSKTHISSQPETIILAAVFGSTAGPGKIRLSSTKQFGFLGGDTKAYFATDLAKNINSSPKEEVQPYLIQAFFIPKIFKVLYNTFINDVVSDSKLKQQVLQLDVHPENAEECVKVFKDSAIYAGLGEKIEEDKIQIKSNTINSSENKDFNNVLDDELNDENENLGNKSDANNSQQVPHKNNHSSGGVSYINVNIDVDPSMDPEKLEKLLKLLKTYGAI